MIENLETLLELHRQGSMSKAATVLRISQSGVSKRIAVLENYYGSKLIEASGRKVVLSGEGLAFLDRVGPLLLELRESLQRKNEDAKRKIVLGVSESILSSWGAELIEKVLRKLDLELTYHTHRSPVVIEKVEEGIYDLGYCAGKISNPRTLVSEPLKNEEMVLLSKNVDLLKAERPRKLLCIERSSATWKSIQGELKKRNLKVAEELESFFAIAQLAMAGRGVGLIPLGVAKTLSIKEKHVKKMKPKLYRPIQLVFKKSKLAQNSFKELIREFRACGL